MHLGYGSLPQEIEPGDEAAWEEYHEQRCAEMGAVYDKESADRAVRFITLLRHVKGRWGGDPFELMPWQEHQIVRPFYGYKTEGGFRRYRRCYIFVAKKNGKTALGAALANYGLHAENEPGAEVYSAAADRDQASLVFQSAAPMCRNQPTLSARSKILETQRRIAVASTNSFYQVLSAEVETKHGLSPYYVLFDELHAQPHRHLWDVLTQGAFAARQEPALFVFSTAGYNRNSICHEEWDYARKVRDGLIDDPQLLPVIYEVPEDADWTDEATWYQANPSLGVTLDIDDMRAEFRKAKELPANENSFRRLRLNQWVSQQTRWMPMEAWDACNGDAVSDDRDVCCAGLDLSTTTDLSAFVLAFPRDDGSVDIKPHFWLPADDLREREKRDRVPYGEWERQGLLTLTEGNVIDYEHIRSAVNEAAQRYRIKGIAYDPWNATQLVTQLLDDGAPMVQMSQGYRSISAPTKHLMKLVLDGKLRHGDNPILRWMADNVTVTTDPNGNIKPDKAKSTARIDGIVALVMALDQVIRESNRTSVYATRDLREIDL